MESKSISVIIPAFNEEVTLKACLESAKGLNPLEIIVVDGGSTDGTREIAQDAGAIAVKSSKGRGIQMNKGASLAEGEILLFLHADTLMPEAGINFPAESLNGYVGGFFKLRFSDNAISMKLVELFANVRARIFSLPYGDQAIFIRKDVFEKIDGFKEYPFLEDIDLAMRIRKIGKLKYIPLTVIVSSRRLKKGYPLSPIFVSLRNVIIALFFMLGISPYRLIRLYR